MNEISLMPNVALWVGAVREKQIAELLPIIPMFFPTRCTKRPFQRNSKPIANDAA